MSLVHHLAFRTDDVGVLADFYVHWLGFAIARDERPRSIWLSLGPRAVLMIEGRASDEPRVPLASRDLVAFHVTERRREELAAQLTASDMLEGRTEHTLYFRDLDGRRIGVSSYPL